MYVLRLQLSISTNQHKAMIDTYSVGTFLFYFFIKESLIVFSLSRL